VARESTLQISKSDFTVNSIIDKINRGKVVRVSAPIPPGILGRRMP
jgi:hypothetical protein